MIKYSVIFILLFSSCKVLRNINRVSTDSASVSKVNVLNTDTSKSGNTTKQTTKEELEWWKKTESYQPPAPGVTNVYPSTIIYEGGKGVRQTDYFDSAWVRAALSSMQLKYDSINAKNQSFQKQSESKTKGLGLFFVVLICIGCVVAYAVLSRYIKFKRN